MELKPCPFCGGEPTFYDESGVGLGWMVYCPSDKCGVAAETERFVKPEHAIDVWNTRAERTCRIKEDADTGCFLVCSECGAIQPEEWTVYYCWNCGAKVVGR